METELSGNLSAVEKHINNCFDSNKSRTENLFKSNIENKTPVETAAPDLSDAYSLGRKIESLRIDINRYITLSELDEVQSEKGLFNVIRIMGDLLLIEARLRILDICSDLRRQMGQQRRSIGINHKSSFDFEEEGDDVLPKDSNGEYDIEIITPYEASEIKSKSQDWLYIISKKFNDFIEFTTPKDSRLDMNMLINSTDKFFGDSVWEWMEEETKASMEESCKCLAFGAPTACVMLSLRAVENSLRRWYTNQTNRDIQNRTWGQVLGEFEDMYEKDERPIVLSNLEYLKSKRNSVSHPDESPSQREAERTLYRVEGTISDIYDNMK